MSVVFSIAASIEAVGVVIVSLRKSYAAGPGCCHALKALCVEALWMASSIFAEDEGVEVEPLIVSASDVVLLEDWEWGWG